MALRSRASRRARIARRLACILMTNFIFSSWVRCLGPFAAVYNRYFSLLYGFAAWTRRIFAAASFTHFLSLYLKIALFTKPFAHSIWLSSPNGPTLNEGSSFHSPVLGFSKSD